MIWLAAVSVALAVLAGLCASAEVALLRAVRAGEGALGPPGAGPGNGRGAAAGRGVGAGDSATSAGLRQLRAVLAEPTRYLSLLVVARVAGEAGAVVAMTAAFVGRFGTGWRTYLVAVAVMAAVLYVVAGIWPRALGRRYGWSLSLTAAAVLYPVTAVLGPVPGLLLRAGRLLTPARGGRDDAFTSEGELRGLVDLLEERRVIEPGERAMIHSVFELGDTIVREVMVPRTEMVFTERGKTVRQVLSLALRSGFSRIPVVGENEDDVIGVAYLKDLVARSREHPEAEAAEKVESVMRPATFVPESKPVDELLREMQARQIHVAIVIDEYGGTAGLATIEDILEEIVGEIADEYDREQPVVEWLAPGRARVTARLPVADLAELFGVMIDAEDVETAGGLLAHALGRVPIAGSTATIAGLALTAESTAGRRNRIGTVTVERVPASPAPADRQAHAHRNGHDNGHGAAPPA